MQIQIANLPHNFEFTYDIQDIIEFYTYLVENIKNLLKISQFVCKNFAPFQTIKLLNGTILLEFRLSRIWMFMVNAAIVNFCADCSHFNLSLLLWGKFARFEK